MELDHLILPVTDVARSLAFYTGVVGLVHEGRQPPFEVLRVSPGFTIQLAPWGTKVSEHLAFAMDAAEFEGVFDRIRAAGVPYGDDFHKVGNQQGPGRAPGARGVATALYCHDPSGHLIEIRCYPDVA